MINQAQLLGRVGKLESKTSKNGTQVTNISLATAKKTKGQDGQYTEQTTWHNVYCFAKLSEVVSKFVQVGDLIFVNGEIQHRKIEQGEKAGQYSYSISATGINFMPKPKPAVVTPAPVVAAKSNSSDEDDVPW